MKLRGEKSSKKLLDEKYSIPLGPIIFAIILLLPTPVGMTWAAHKVIALIVWVVFWWITEPMHIYMTCIFGFFLAIILNIIPVADIFGLSFGGPLVWVIVSALIVMTGMIKYGLGRRWALYMLSRRWVGASTFRFLVAFILAEVIMSAFIPNVPVAMAFAALAVAFLKIQGIPRGALMGTAMVLLAGIVSTVGGFATPLGATGPNFLMMGIVEKYAGYSMSLFEWMAVGVPVVILMTLVTLLIVKIFVSRMGVKELPRGIEWCREEYAKLGKWSPGEKGTLAVILILFGLWMVPDFARVIFGTGSPEWQTAFRYFNIFAISTLCAALMFLIPVNWKKREPLLKLSDIGPNVLGIGILIAFVLLLVNLLANPEIGLLSYISGGIKGLGWGLWPSFGITFWSFGFVTQFTEALAFIPISTGIVAAIAPAFPGFALIPGLLAVAFATMMGCLLPVSSIPITTAYAVGRAEGYGNVRDYIKFGAPLTILYLLVLFLFTYPLAVLIFP